MGNFNSVNLFVIFDYVFRECFLEQYLLLPVSLGFCPILILMCKPKGQFAGTRQMSELTRLSRPGSDSGLPVNVLLSGI